MHKISTCLWFDSQAEQAAAFYVSLFKNSRIVSTNLYAEGTPMPAGSVMTVEFELDGEPYTALNGGPIFQFTPAISLVVNCESQAEIDDFWAAFTAEGEEGQCGWLTDKFGVSWQIVPVELLDYIAGPDKAGAQRANDVMLPMKKLDIAEIRRAYEGN